MSVESTRSVMERYFEADHSDTSMLADDVVFTNMADGQETHGPEGVQQMLHYFYHAVFEGEFVGRHVGEFAGIPTTGKDVRVPLCVVYDVEGERIQRARIYLEMPVMLRQLGVGM